MSKPLEFKIEEKYDSVNEEDYYTMTFFYEDGTTQEFDFYEDMPKGLELNKHYFIGDLYGEPVVDDRKGL
jgi:hypothetical protein